MATEGQKRAAEKYRKKSVKQVIIRFFPGDADIYEYLHAQENMSGYIKQLIRKDMEQRSG